MWQKIQFLGYLDKQEQRMGNAVDCIKARERNKPGSDVGEAGSILARG